MSPTIRIPDDIYVRLQNRAKPFVDTPAAIIERLLDHLEGCSNIEPPIGKGDYSGNEVLELNSENPDDLLHAKIIKATFGDQKINMPNWNKLVRFAHLLAMRNTGSFYKLSEMTNSNIINGICGDHGWHYLTDASISIQDTNANYAWKNALNLAKGLNVSIEVLFEWRNNDRASHPGMKGSLSWDSLKQNISKRA